MRWLEKTHYQGCGMHFVTMRPGFMFLKAHPRPPPTTTPRCQPHLPTTMPQSALRSTMLLFVSHPCVCQWHAYVTCQGHVTRSSSVPCARAGRPDPHLHAPHLSSTFSSLMKYRFLSNSLSLLHVRTIFRKYERWLSHVTAWNCFPLENCYFQDVFPFGFINADSLISKLLIIISNSDDCGRIGPFLTKVTETKKMLCEIKEEFKIPFKCLMR